MAVRKGLRGALKVCFWFFSKNVGSRQIDILDQKIMCHYVSNDMLAYESNPVIFSNNGSRKGTEM